MAGTSILQEFLVELGFDVNSDQYKKFVGALDSVTKGVAVLGTALAVSSAAVETLVKRTTAHFADLYYSSQKVGDSVANIEAWAYGAQQAGIEADEAKSLIEGFARAVRLQPGLEGVLKGFGIDTAEAKTDQLVDLVNKLRTMNPAVAAQYGNMFGIDPDSLVLLEQKLPAIAKGMDDYRAKLKAAGVNADEMAKKSRDMDLAFKNFDKDLGILQARIANDFLPWGAKFLTWADDAVKAFDKLDIATDGWAGKIGGLGATLGAFFGGKAVLGKIGSLLKGGAKAAPEAAPEAAGEGAAAAAGGAGVPALLAWLGPIGAFLATALYPSSTQTQAQEDDLNRQWRAKHPGGGAHGQPHDAQLSGGILALIRKLEGSGDSAISPAGAVGRFQVMPATARRLGADPSRLTDPNYEAGVAAKAVVDIIKQGAKTLDEILVGYNSNPAHLKAFIASHDDPSVLLPETRKYLEHAHKLLGGMDKLGMIDDAAKSRHFAGSVGDMGGARIAPTAPISITVNSKAEITVNEADNPGEVADKVLEKQSRAYGDVVRNSLGATG